MNVNFEVTDTKRAILSVHKGCCGNGSMIVFTPGPSETDHGEHTRIRHCV